MTLTAETEPDSSVTVDEPDTTVTVDEPGGTVTVDTSALIALLADEAPAEEISATLEAATTRLISAGTYVELGIVLGGRGSPLTAAEVVRDLGLTVVAVDDDLAEAAVQAWHRFGRTRHPAALNYGDCFSYALASTRGTPLVATGDDFRRTDLTVLPR